MKDDALAEFFKREIDSLMDLNILLRDCYYLVEEANPERFAGVLVFTERLLSKYGYISNYLKTITEPHWQVSFSTDNAVDEFLAQVEYIKHRIEKTEDCIKELLDNSRSEDIKEKWVDFTQELLKVLSIGLKFQPKHFQCTTANFITDHYSSNPSIEERSILNIAVEDECNTYKIQYRFTPEFEKQLKDEDEREAKRLKKEYDEYYDNHEPENCPACDSSPCICSDPDPG